MSERRYRQRIFASYRDSLAPELEQAAPRDAAASFAQFRLHYAPLLPQDKSAAILDIGCGEGRFLAWLKAEGYANAKGVDGSPQMAELARQRGLDVTHGDMKDALRASAGTLDCVTAFDVLEHLDKDELVELMDLVFAGLKPGGTFVCHTVNADGIAWGRMRYIDLTHEQAFTRYSLAQVFKATGFTRSEFHPVWPADRGLLGAAVYHALRLFVGLVHHAESGSGILNNDHIVSSSLLGKADKA